MTNPEIAPFHLNATLVCQQTHKTHSNYYLATDEPPRYIHTYLTYIYTYVHKEYLLDWVTAVAVVVVVV